MAKTLQFEIKTYSIELNQFMNSNRALIKLVSPDIPHGHGIHYEANVVFMPTNPFDGGDHMGPISNLGGTNFNPIKLTLYFNITMFNDFYQVLSTEKPVTLQVNYEDDADAPKSTTKFISSAALLTGIESPGDFEQVLNNAKLISFPQPQS